MTAWSLSRSGWSAFITSMAHGRLLKRQIPRGIRSIACGGHQAGIDDRTMGVGATVGEHSVAKGTLVAKRETVGNAHGIQVDGCHAQTDTPTAAGMRDAVRADDTAPTKLHAPPTVRLPG